MLKAALDQAGNTQVSILKYCGPDHRQGLLDVLGTVIEGRTWQLNPQNCIIKIKTCKCSKAVLGQGDNTTPG